MFGFLKYVIFALGLLAVYVMIEHFVVNRGEKQTLDETVNQELANVNDVGEKINEEYVQPAVEQLTAE